MGIKITTTHILKVLQVLSWIIFLALCIEAGGILFSAFFALVINPVASQNSWLGVDLSSLYEFDKGYFIAENVLISIVAVMQAILFYLIVKLFYNKKLNLTHPFNNELKRLISNVGYLALGIGLFSLWGAKFTKWLVEKGIRLSDIQSLRLGGADVWFFMGVILLVIAQIFKRGIEIQLENDLTV